MPPSPPNVRGLFGKKTDELILNRYFKRLKDSCIEEGPTTSQSIATVVWYVSLY